MIGDLNRRSRAVNPDGGLGTLTDDEVAEAYRMIDETHSELCNGPHKLCECGIPGCGNPIRKPGGLGNA